MAIRNIYKVGDPVLRQVSRPVTEFNDKLVILAEDMAETMFANDGVGIAAPQVGILKRLIVVSIDDGKNVYTVVNPEIVKASGKRISDEGCLSVPKRREAVERPRHVTISGQDITGKPITIRASNYLATAFCHEIDHLNGVLFIDRAIKF